MAYSLPQSRILFGDAESPRELSERRDELVEAMTKATAEGITGNVTWGTKDDYMPIPQIVRDNSRSDDVRKAIDNLGMAKMAKGTAEYGELAKEWSLTNPVSTGLVPYDLEAPSKLLTPRPTPLRNSIPRLKGQGSARRFKVISGFTGTGTGGITTTQPGINENSTNSGPGGLSYIRGPQCGVAA